MRDSLRPGLNAISFAIACLTLAGVLGWATWMQEDPLLAQLMRAGHGLGYDGSPGLTRGDFGSHHQSSQKALNLAADRGERP